MPHRLHDAIVPLAEKHALQAARAMEAICQQACMTTGLASSLVARGVPVGVADMMATQWQATGMTIRPDVMAPPGIIEQAVARPGITGYPGIAPGLAGIAAGLAGIPGMPGLAGITPGLGGIAGLPGLAGISPLYGDMIY